MLYLVARGGVLIMNLLVQPYLEIYFPTTFYSSSSSPPKSKYISLPSAEVFLIVDSKSFIESFIHGIFCNGIEIMVSFSLKLKHLCSLIEWRRSILIVFMCTLRICLILTVRISFSLIQIQMSFYFFIPFISGEISRVKLWFLWNYCLCFRY